MSRSTTPGLLLVLIHKHTHRHTKTKPVIYRRFVKQSSKSVQPICNSAEESNCEVANRGSGSGNSYTSPKAKAKVRWTHTFAKRIGFFRACEL